MLFNKNNTGTAELKALIGFFYKSNNFDNIKTDIELAEDDIIKLVGQEIYDAVDLFYHGLGLDDSGSGSGSGSGDRTEILTKLVKYMQLPIALNAVHEYSQNTDVSHEDGGRRVKISSETEKLPWEWMLDRDSAAMLRKYYKTCDRLLVFLDKYEDSLPEWKYSEARTNSRKLFINTAEAFNEIYPIDNSRRFFLTLAPFISEVEQVYIRPVIADIFDEVKEAIIDGDTTDYDDMLKYIRYAVAPLTMSIAVKRLSLQVFPEGTLQTVVSEQLTTQAKTPPVVELIRLVSQSLEIDGRQRISDLQEYLLKIAQGEDYDPQIEDIFPVNDDTDTIFRT